MEYVFVRAIAAVLAGMWIGVCPPTRQAALHPPASSPAVPSSTALSPSALLPRAFHKTALDPTARSSLSSLSFFPSPPPQSSSPANPPQAATPAGPTMVGSDVCMGCHEDAAKPLQGTVHKRLLAKDAPVGQGCESCHGPGSEHVDGGGDVAKIFRFKGADAVQVRTHCQACHPMNPMGAHDRRQIACTRCHALHRPVEGNHLLAKPEADLCQGCHSNGGEGEAKGSHNGTRVRP